MKTMIMIGSNCVCQSLPWYKPQQPKGFHSCLDARPEVVGRRSGSSGDSSGSS